MSNPITCLLILGFLASTLNASRTEADSEELNFQQQLNLANNPLSLQRGFQVTATFVKKESDDKFKGLGVHFRKEKAFDVHQKLKDQLEIIDKQNHFYVDFPTLTEAQRLFDEPYVESATFVQWTKPDNGLVTCLQKSAEEVTAVLTDDSGNKIWLWFAIDRSKYLSPTASITFRKNAGEKFQIELSRLKKILNHLTNLDFPDWVLNLYIEKLAAYLPIFFEAKVPSSMTEAWSRELAVIKFKDRYGIAITEWKDEENGMTLRIYESSYGGKYVEMTTLQGKRFTLSVVIGSISQNPAVELRIYKTDGGIIELSKTKVSQLLGLVLDVPFPPPILTNVVAFLADPKSPRALETMISNYNIDFNTAQLASKQKI